VTRRSGLGWKEYWQETASEWGYWRDSSDVRQNIGGSDLFAVRGNMPTSFSFLFVQRRQVAWSD